MVSGKLKLFIKSLFVWTPYFFGVYKYLSTGKILILMYHRVLPESEINKSLIQPGMYVTAKTFNKHLQYLAANYQVISITELLKRLKSHELDIERRYCVITFDDGWVDNYRFAYPLLKKYDMPASIFLVFDYVGTDKWFWPEQLSYLFDRIRKGGCDFKCRQLLYEIIKEFDVDKTLLMKLFSNKASFSAELVDRIIKNLKAYAIEDISDLINKMQKILGVAIPKERLMLNWEEIREMAQNSISFGAHSCSHSIMTLLSDDKLKEEINRCCQIIREIRSIGIMPVFSFPNGNYNQKIIDLIRKNGFEAALTTKPGYINHNEEDVFELKRISIHNDISYSIPFFAFRLYRMNINKLFSGNFINKLRTIF